MFGSVNTLFSGLAFAGVLFTIVLLVREEDYQKATLGGAEKAKQNPKQNTPESVRLASKVANNTPA